MRPLAHKRRKIPVLATTTPTLADLLLPTSGTLFRAYLRPFPPDAVMGDQSYTWDNPLSRWFMDAYDLDLDVYTDVARGNGEQHHLPDWMRSFQRDLAARTIADSVTAHECLVSLDAIL
jgi:hypothetical protein